MAKILSLVVLCTTLLACLIAPSAQAQTITRTFVSGTGSDNPTCSYTAPCRHLQNAYNVTPANGEIDVLDPAGYGNLVITQPVSILGHDYTSLSAASSGGTAISINLTSGGYVSIAGVEIDGGGSGGNGISFTSSNGSLSVRDTVIRNFTGYGITINAPQYVGSDVDLTGVVIDGGGAGTEGIFVTNASILTIANCVVRNFLKNGIDVAAAYELALVNTISSDNGYNGDYSGIYIHSNNSLEAAITGTTATGNGSNGIVAQGTGVSLTIFSSNASNNNNDGVLAQSSASVIVRDTVAADNESAGFEAQSSAQLTLAHSVASNNPNYGIYVNGGTVNTYKDNNIVGSLHPVYPGSNNLTTITAY